MSSDEKRKMMDILARVEKESADSVEEDNDDLHERLQDLDLDKDTSKIWSRLTEQVCKLLVSKGAKIRNRYNQVPHLTQDTNGKVTNSQLDTTNESQEVSPFPAGDHKAHINRRAQRHSKRKTEKNIKKIHRRSTALEPSV